MEVKEIACLGSIAGFTSKDDVHSLRTLYLMSHGLFVLKLGLADTFIRFSVGTNYFFKGV